MPTRWNVGPSPLVLDWNHPAVLPGDSHDFTDEQIDAGIAGDWSETDPRAGLSDEQVFKRARDRSRPELDDEAHSLGIDTTDLHTKQDVASAIQAALDAAAQTIEETSPAEPEKE